MINNQDSYINDLIPEILTFQNRNMAAKKRNTKQQRKKIRVASKCQDTCSPGTSQREGSTE